MISQTSAFLLALATFSALFTVSPDHSLPLRPLTAVVTAVLVYVGLAVHA